jgi:hypothetical protein
LYENGKLAKLLIQYLEEDIPEEYKNSYQSKVRCFASITTGWIFDDLFDDVIELNENSKLLGECNSTFTLKYPVVKRPDFQILVAYRGIYNTFTQTLSKIIKEKRIQINTSAIAEENFWRTAYHLTLRHRRYSSNYLSPINISEIDEYLKTIKLYRISIPMG